MHTLIQRAIATGRILFVAQQSYMVVCANVPRNLIVVVDSHSFVGAFFVVVVVICRLYCIVNRLFRCGYRRIHTRHAKHALK